MKDSEVIDGMNSIVQDWGGWSYDINLQNEIWTKGGKKIPHTRLRRIIQIANDLSKKGLNGSRVLDLGCLDGLYSIEFAKQGAITTGVDVREGHIAKCNFYKSVNPQENLNFVLEDVRNVDKEKFGQFDIILCSGLLYHLDAPDSFQLLERLYEMTNDLLIIDTHISLNPQAVVNYQDRDYHGHYFQEFPEGTTLVEQKKSIWSAYKNNFSFWFTRPTLINFLQNCGFSSVYECFNPPHLNFGKPIIEHKNRCTLVALKRKAVEIQSSPIVNNLVEYWPEDSLSYNL